MAKLWLCGVVILLSSAVGGAQTTSSAFAGEPFSTGPYLAGTDFTATSSSALLTAYLELAGGSPASPAKAFGIGSGLTTGFDPFSAVLVDNQQPVVVMGTVTDGQGTQSFAAIGGVTRAVLDIPAGAFVIASFFNAAHRRLYLLVVGAPEADPGTPFVVVRHDLGSSGGAWQLVWQAPPEYGEVMLGTAAHFADPFSVTSNVYIITAPTSGPARPYALVNISIPFAGPVREGVLRPLEEPMQLAIDSRGALFGVTAGLEIGPIHGFDTYDNVTDARALIHAAGIQYPGLAYERYSDTVWLKVQPHAENTTAPPSPQSAMIGYQPALFGQVAARFDCIPGQDVPGSQLGSPYNATAGQCASACMTDIRCLAYVHEAVNASATCYLKSAVTPVTMDAPQSNHRTLCRKRVTAQSRTRTCWRRYGRAVSSAPTIAPCTAAACQLSRFPTAESCQQLCDITPGCSAVQYGVECLTKALTPTVSAGVTISVSSAYDYYERTACGGAEDWGAVPDPTPLPPPNPAPANPPTARWQHAQTVMGDHLYVHGGTNDRTATGLLSSFHRLQLKTNRWEAISPSLPVPTARAGHTMVAYGGSLYLLGGVGGPGDTPLFMPADFWAFDTRSMAWTSLTDGNNTLPKQRAYHATAVLGDKMYVYGGVGNLTGKWADRTLYSYNFTSRKWKLEYVTRTPEVADTGFGTSPNLRGWYDAQGLGIPGVCNDYCRLVGNGPFVRTCFLGGTNIPYSPTPQDTAIQYCPNQAEMAAPEWRSGHSLVAIGTSLYLFGGNNWDASVWEFNAVTRLWTQRNPAYAPLGRRLHGAAAAGGRVLVYGGLAPSDNCLSDFWAFSPANSGSWRQLSGGFQPLPRAGMRLSWWPAGGRFYAFGGVRENVTGTMLGDAIYYQSFARDTVRLAPLTAHYLSGTGCYCGKRGRCVATSQGTNLQALVCSCPPGRDPDARCLPVAPTVLLEPQVPKAQQSVTLVFNAGHNGGTLRGGYAGDRARFVSIDRIEDCANDTIPAFPLLARGEQQTVLTTEFPTDGSYAVCYRRFDVTSEEDTEGDGSGWMRLAGEVTVEALSCEDRQLLTPDEPLQCDSVIRPGLRTACSSWRLVTKGGITVYECLY